jgi:hypothetical protein
MVELSVLVPPVTYPSSARHGTNDVGGPMEDR